MKRDLFTTNRIFNGIFIAVLCLPIVAQFSGMDDQLVQSSENRLLSKLPSINKKGIRSFVDQTDAWYEDNFGFRNVLFRGYSTMKYHGLGVSPLPKKVTKGQDDWLYLSFEGANLKKTTPLRFQNGLKNLIETLSQKSEELAAQGIQFYFAIAPGKQTVCPYYLPLHVQEGYIPKLFSYQKALLTDQQAFHVIDLSKQLPQGQAGCGCYRKTDHHWNDLGAFWGAKELLETIQRDFPDVPVPDLRNYHQTTVPQKWGAHNRMLNLPIQVDELILKPKHNLTYHQVENKHKVLKKFRLAPEKYETRYQSTSDSTNHLKAMIWHDSFIDRMKMHLNASFGETVYFRRAGGINLWDNELIRKENPDILILEINEGPLARFARGMSRPRAKEFLFERDHN